MREFNGDAASHAMASAYEHTQERLRSGLNDYLGGIDPKLTHHGSRHIADVKDNVVALLADGGCVNSLSGVELYCLGMSILFHDAGMIYGREEHQQHIGRIFDEFRGRDDVARREKALVMKAVRAHTGLAQDGSPDTLKDLAEEHLNRRRVRLRDVAAVLRLADELAEGPYRTSAFVRKIGGYSRSSEVYHEYASSCHVFIDRLNRRIVLSYEVEIVGAESEGDRRDRLSTLLCHIYRRINKVNQERQYNRYYCELLEPFRSTEASFNFHSETEILEVGLTPISLTDIVIPGEHVKSIPEIDSNYTVARLVPELLALAGCSTSGGVCEA